MQETLRDAGSIPGSGRCPGGGNGNPLHILFWRISQEEETVQSMTVVTESDMIEVTQHTQNK